MSDHLSVDITQVSVADRAGNETTFTAEVTNTDSTDVDFDAFLDIRIPDEGGYDQSTDSVSGTVAANSTASVTLSWSSSDMGTYSGLVRLSYSGVSDETGPFIVELGYTEINPNSIGLGWTPTSGADVQHIYRDTTADVPIDEAHRIGSVAGGDDTYLDDDGLQHGNEYHYAIEALEIDGDTENQLEVIGEAPITSGFHSVTGVSLELVEQSGQNAIDIEWDGQLDNGNYVVQYHPSGGGVVNEAGQVAYDAEKTFTMENVSGGDEYTIYVGQRTPDVGFEVHGEDSSSVITPPDTSVWAADQVDIDWSLGGGGYMPETPDAIEIYRQRLTSIGPWPEQLVYVDESPEPFQSGHSDTSVLPDTTYKYRIEFVFDSEDNVVTPWSQSQTTEAIAARRDVPSPIGWYAQLTHADNTTIEPSVLDGSRLEPRLNELPEARITVPPESGITADAFEAADMAVWKDGQQRAVDELERVESSPDTDELIGVGATQLERTIERDVRERTTSGLVEDLIAEETDYVADVDAFDGETREDVVVGGAADALEYEQLLGQDPFPETSPLHITDDGAVDAHPSAIHVEGEDYDSGDETIVSNSEHSGGAAVRVSNVGDIFNREVSYTVDIPYRIENPRFWIRVKVDSSSHLGVAIDIEGVDVGNGFGEAAVDSAGFYHEQVDVTGTLEPGETQVTFTIGQNNGNSDGVEIDCFDIYDTRYPFDFPGDTPDEEGEPAPADPATDGVIPYPQTYADELVVETEIIPQFQRAIAGALEVETPDSNGVAKLELSNDNGKTWIEATDTALLEGTFTDPAPYMKARLTLARYDDADSGSATPSNGDKFQRLDAVTVRADLDPEPLIIDRLFTGDLIDVLSEIADTTNGIMEAWQDGDDTVVTWTWPGQRTTDADIDVSDYTVEKNNRRILQCTVRGASLPVSDEEVTASIDEAVPLTEDYVIRSDVVVREIADEDPDRYEMGLDFELDAINGTITALADGDISDGETIEVDYAYEVRGTFTHDEFDGDPRTSTTERVPSATSQRSAEQVAAAIVSEASRPRWSAEVDLPWDTLQHVRLSSALDLDVLPGPPQAVFKSETVADGVRMRLGSRRNSEEYAQRIESTLQAVSDQA